MFKFYFQHNMMKTVSLDLFRTLIRFCLSTGRMPAIFLMTMLVAAVVFAAPTQVIGETLGAANSRQIRGSTARFGQPGVAPQALPPIVSPDDIGGYEDYAPGEIAWAQYQDESEWSSSQAALPSARSTQGSTQSNAPRIASIEKSVPPPTTDYQGPGRIIMSESDGSTPNVSRESNARTLRELNPPSPSTVRSRRPLSNGNMNGGNVVNAYDTQGDIMWDDAGMQGDYELLPRQLGHLSGYGTDPLLQQRQGLTDYAGYDGLGMGDGMDGMYYDPYGGMYGYGDGYGGMYGGDMYGMNGYGYGYGQGMYGYGYPGSYGQGYGHGLASAFMSHILCSNAWENLTVGFGGSGFKSPLDFHNGGAFGFSETINWASPSTSSMPVNFQAGFRAVQAFPSGYRDDFNSWHRGCREQYFGTVGIFRRNVMCTPLNVGLAYDFLNDKYIGDVDLEQLRAEVSYGGMYGYEFGYRGAFGVRNDSFHFHNRYKVNVHVIDYHTLFVKKYFANGGEGSLAGGATEYGDLLVRAEYSIPLSNDWGLKNSLSYVVPKGGHSPASPHRESWDVSLQLVYQPRGGVLAGFCNPFRSFFDVADNGTFLQRAKR